VIITVYDTLTPGLNALAARLRDTSPLMAALGRELRNAHAEHFEGRGGTFWPRFGDKTVLTHYDAISAEITVGEIYGRMLLHKISGGTIRAKTGKYLAIPARDEARKLGSPSAWSKPGDGKLVPVFGRGRKLVGLALAQDFGRGGGKKRFNFKAAREGSALRSRGAWGTGIMMYWLKESVYQAADPAALPPTELVESRLLSIGQEVVEREVLRANG
jgi:hypothetical protein